MTFLNFNICSIIASHIYKPKYQLLDWFICKNSNSILLIRNFI